MQYLCMISILALCHQPSPIILQLSINGTSTIQDLLLGLPTLSPKRTNYGKFSIKFQGAKIWNSLSEETKSLHRLALKKHNKNIMMQRTANENAACLRRICKRSDQPKIERLVNNDASFQHSISLASLFTSLSRKP